LDRVEIYEARLESHQSILHARCDINVEDLVDAEGLFGGQGAELEGAVILAPLIHPHKSLHAAVSIAYHHVEPLARVQMPNLRAEDDLHRGYVAAAAVLLPEMDELSLPGDPIESRLEEVRLPQTTSCLLIVLDMKERFGKNQRGYD
jgi:hypothetical protein